MFENISLTAFFFRQVQVSKITIFMFVENSNINTLKKFTIFRNIFPTSISILRVYKSFYYAVEKLLFKG